MEKVVIAKHVFRVTSKELITPHYIRIRLMSDEDIEFDKCIPGANNKIFIPPVGSKEVHFATFDSEKAEWVMPDENVKPIVRTYTHRAIDPISKEITIDFVNHGDNGPASSWARNAKISDQLGVAMKIRNKELYPPSDWYFLIGDATAIPVICCILESLPASAKGQCIMEIASPEDIHPEVYHPGFEIQWIYNQHPEKGSELTHKVKDVLIPKGLKTFAYVACEYQSVKDIRTYFKEILNWTNQEFYAFSYWQAGVAEDKSIQDRHSER